MDIRIVNLADREDCLDNVSRWLWQEWGSGSAFEYIRYAVQHNTQTDRIPMTFVAIADDEPIGTVSLWMNDLKCRQDLYPWVASLYVAEAKRRMGVGERLQAHAIDEARKLGYPHLYLLTDHVGYYERFGWAYKELAPKGDGQYTRIYSLDL
ncbi:GNAT family N-acetyltransferase [Paenibacillus ihumii]|uniref:GNAT family N-acetyltransferase n=1 Tax=Paenibacillus ihumii TaxID=687436 RepID=UPI0006D833E8|nr:GNAT family N-acetyltransferase [Paenibacillus ihumii]